MADASAIAVFGEPEVEVRLGRDKWTKDENAVKPLDDLVNLFHKSFQKNDAGYRRSVDQFDYSVLETPAKAEGQSDEDYAKVLQRRVSRIAERLNARAEELKVPVHARVVRGKLHMVTGAKPVITRERKAKAEA